MPSSAQDTLTAMLKKRGYSVTRPRLAVFRALLGQDPLTMPELVQRAREADRASVYRTVELFEQLGIVLRVNIGWKYKLELSEAFSHHHHHLSCVECGKIVALNEHALEDFIDRLSAEHGFTPHSHQIEIQGVCQSCRQKQKQGRQ